MNIEYAVQIIWSPEDNAYVAITAELPGCIADGKTPEEALANVRVIINEWIEVAREDNREIPKPLTIEDLSRLQHQAQAEFQKNLEAEVKKVVSHVLGQITLQQQPANSWNFRSPMAFDPVESLVTFGGRR